MKDEENISRLGGGRIYPKYIWSKLMEKKFLQAERVKYIKKKNWVFRDEERVK